MSINQRKTNVWAIGNNPASFPSNTSGQLTIAAPKSVEWRHSGVLQRSTLYNLGSRKYIIIRQVDSTGEALVGNWGNCLDGCPLGNTTDKVCQTEACRQQTADLLKQMDRTVDPCQDFYQFACGGYINRTVVPKDKGSVGEGSCVKKCKNTPKN